MCLMGYYVSHMIGIRTGGVFSGDVDTEDMKRRIAAIVRTMRSEAEDLDKPRSPDLGGEDGDPSHCMSQELVAHKGSYVVLAGVFNYWRFEEAEEFAKRLSKEFGTEVMHMTWHEEEDTVQAQVWLDGRPLFEVAEGVVGRILRRVM